MEQSAAYPGDRELEALFVSAGIVVPAELKVGAMSEARDLRRVTSLLRQPRTAASEPSNIFSLAKDA